MAKTQDKREEKKKDSAMRRFGRNLTELAARGALPPLIGRPAVIGISLTSLVAGTNYRGEFEERLEAVVRVASLDPKPILFIDEIHLLLGAGSASGSMDAANVLKPALARGAIRVIGATTIREYRQTIEKDGALERRFQAVRFRTLTPQIEEKSCGETPLARPAARRSSHVCVELDESAEELILRVGFSGEYGARNLERVMDRMLGSLIAEALLSGEISAGQTIRLEATDGRIQFSKSSPDPSSNAIQDR